MRKLCPTCKQSPVAINCYKNNKTYYRSQCDKCIRAGKKLPTQKRKWSKAGYKKKKICDRCGFRAKYSSQISVYHINSDLNDVSFYNLRSICLNCAEEIYKSGSTWTSEDLLPDF